MADVFVSYKAEDRARIAPLVRALESDGVSVWWDAHIGGGDDWRQTILRHLEAAKCVLVVWSKRSVGPHGEFVRDEAVRAKRRGTYLPIRIDRVDPPLGFGEMQALDLAGWKDDASDPRYEAVVTALRSRFKIRTRHGQTASTKAKGLDRRMLIAGGSVATLAIAGGGTWAFLRPSAAKSNSIAVLPFENLSGDPSQAYFSDGIAEELRSDLSRIPGLKVVARTSSEAVRNADAVTAAAKLHVSDILTGSVRRSAQMLRISAQLVDGKDGTERWSEVYDRPVGDALQIQSDIADRVAEALSIRLAGADKKRLIEGGTNNPQAQDLILKAREAFETPSSAEFVQRALGMVDAAIELDPNYAGAWALKAALQTILAGVFTTSAAQARATYDLATQSAKRAIQLAPDSRLGYQRLADILDQQLQRRAARSEYLKMQSLPGGEGDDSFAVHLSETLHHQQAIQLIGEALNRDPLNPRTIWSKMYILGNARMYPQALATARELLNVGEKRRPPHAFVAYYLMLQGRNSEADVEFSRMGPTSPGFATAWQVALSAREGNTGRAERQLEELRSVVGDAGYYQIAESEAQLGRKNQAMDALDKALASRDPGLTGILVDAMLDPLRSEPRFQAIVKKLDFPT
jgi:serine/threonine-protein kinase